MGNSSSCRDLYMRTNQSSRKRLEEFGTSVPLIMIDKSSLENEEEVAGDIQSSSFGRSVTLKSKKPNQVSFNVTA